MWLKQTNRCPPSSPLVLLWMHWYVCLGILSSVLSHLTTQYFNLFVVTWGRWGWCEAGNPPNPPQLLEPTNTNNAFPLVYPSITRSHSSLHPARCAPPSISTFFYFSVEPQPICSMIVNMTDSVANDGTTKWKWTLSLSLSLFASVCQIQMDNYDEDYAPLRARDTGFTSEISDLDFLTVMFIFDTFAQQGNTMWW